MAGHGSEELPRTRARETISPTDVFPLLGTPEYNELIRGDQSRAGAAERAQLGTATELSSHAEVMQDEVLRAMAAAQAASLRQATEAAEPTMRGKTDAEIIAYLNELRFSDPNKALVIINASIDGAAAILDERGITSTTLAAAISRAVVSLGGNLSGAATDLSRLDTEGILTIAGVGFGSFIVTGSAGVGFTLGGIATVIQSPHLTDAGINIVSAGVRGAGQLAALPVRGAMRTVDIINNLGQDGLLDNIQANAAGMGNDVINSIAYTFDGEYSPENGTDSNLLLREFLEQGEMFAPTELLPLVRYLKEVRNGGPISRLLTVDELETAGAFMKKAEDLVTPDQFIAIDQRRRAGEVLSDTEKQMYILGKYCMLINQSFLGDNALQPDATLVRAAYEAENGILNLDDAMPLSAGLMAADFSWTREQRNAFNRNVEGMGITFETITQGGFVGVALTAYLALTYGLMMINTVKAGIDKTNKVIETRRNNRRLANDKRTLSNRPRTRLRAALANTENKTSQVINALIGGQVLEGSSNFERSLRNAKLNSFASDKVTALLQKAEDDTAEIGSIRNAFFDMIESNNTIESDTDRQSRRDYYQYKDALNQIDLIYKYQPRGEAKEIRLGGQTFTIGRPARADFTFTTVHQLAQISNPRNFYRYMTNSGNGRALRMRNPQNQEVYLKIRMHNGKFQFDARSGEGWKDFDLNDLTASLSNESTTAE